MSPPRTKSIVGVAQVVAAAALFGTAGTVQALAPTSAAPASVGAARLVLGGVGLLVVAPIAGGDRRRALRLWRTWPGLLCGLLTASFQILFFFGVAHAGVAVGTLVTIGSGPIFAGCFARIMLREPISRPWLLSTLVAVVGLGLLVGPVGNFGTDGLLAALGAGLCYSLYTVLIRRAVIGGESATTLIASAFSLGGLALLPVLVLSSNEWLNSVHGLAAALWLGFATTTAAYLLFGRGLTKIPAGPVTTLVLTEPIVATMLGVTVLGERLAFWQVFGLLLVCAGVGVQGWSQSFPDRGESLA